MRVLRISHSAVVDAWRERERAVRRQGIEVLSLSASTWNEGGGDVELVPQEGEPVQGVRTWGRHPALFVYDPRPLWRALGSLWDVIDIHEEPFALATAEILALRWLRQRRTPYTLYSAQNIDKRYPPPIRWLERMALRNASGISVCNANAGEIVQRKGFPGQASLIGLGLDRKHFVPAGFPADAAQSKLAGTPAYSVVGYAGRLEPHKGVDVLLRAIAASPRLRLRIAGSGPDSGRLHALTAGLHMGDRVEFLGTVDQEGLPDFYRGLDVLAIPSLNTRGWIEQFGRVAVEAMACGTPVVASDSGALPDVVGGAGLLVTPGDADALRRALERVAREPARAAELRARGMERARAYDWRAIGDAYAALYRRAAGPIQARSAERSLEVVVVAYGGAALLRKALEPLGDLPVTVVDNSSSPQVRQVCHELGARYLDPGFNGGFAAGVNAALRSRLRPGADVLLLNPDAVISREGIAALHAALRADPSLASVGPAQVDAEGRPARVGWPFPSPARFWLDAVGLGRLRSQTDFAIGSVLLLRAEALEQVGPLDEGFFLYSEETDWAFRAARLGWRHVVVPDATAIHVGAATSSDPRRREVHFHASQERYLRKHYGALGWQAARAAQVSGSTVRAVLLRGDRADRARQRLGLYARGPVRVEEALRSGPIAPDSASVS